MKETMEVSLEEKRLIEFFRESRLDWHTIYEAVEAYCRDKAEELYFQVMTDPENTSANERRYNRIEQVLKEVERISQAL